MENKTYTIYFFDMQTKEYTNTNRTFPKTSNTIEVPPDGTLIQPPKNTRSDMTAIWDIQGQEWQLVMDYRHIDVYDKKTKEKINFKLGEVPDPASTTQIAPTDPREEWDEDTGSWLLPLPILKETQKAQIKQDYLKALDGPCPTGITGNKAKAGDPDELEEAEVIISSNMISRDHIQLLIEEPSKDKEGDKESKDTVVIRDYYNNYIQILTSDLPDLAKAQKTHAKELLYRKWMLQERIDLAQTREEIEAVDWKLRFDDLDTNGE